MIFADIYYTYSLSRDIFIEKKKHTRKKPCRLPGEGEAAGALEVYDVKRRER